MLQHVWERAGRAKSLTRLVIATDDVRVLQEARGFGAAVRMTRADHPSGTDRVAEAAAADPAGIVVNIQGDEPLIEPSAIDAAVNGLMDSAGAPMATLKKRISDPAELSNPNVVKVITNLAGDAIYFTRAAAPYVRSGGTAHYKHIGLYVYRKEFLLGYSNLCVGPLERAERLEQLRALENGYRIRVVETDYESLGVDTPEDLRRVAARIEAEMAGRRA